MRYKEFRENVADKTFYHLSNTDRSNEGISRIHAGSNAAGAERNNFHMVGDGLDPDSAMIHLYKIGRKAEHIVLQKSQYYHEISIELNLMSMESSNAQDAVNKADSMNGNRAINFSKIVKSMGYDGIELRGLIQLYRDIKPEEISKVIKLTPESRRLLGRSGQI